MKLALITSKEEDEDKGGTGSSNDTEAILVDDAAPAGFTAPPEQSPSPPAGLGKHEKHKHYVMVLKPGSPKAQTPPPYGG